MIGAGNRVVGYGIDLVNGGYEAIFRQAGYSTEMGAEIDIEFVDGLEDKEIADCLNEIKALTAGLNLKEYQLHALVSRAYNCGVHDAVGVKRGNPALDFVDSYKKYWDESRDDYFIAKNSSANFSHQLYTQYMSKPTTSNGKYLKGLEERRKSEWRLFQTGYYDRINEWYQEGASKIIQIADTIHKYMEANNYGYCVNTSGRGDECASRGENHGLNTTFEASKKGHHHSCCATYVSWVLQEAGLISDSEHTDSSLGIDNLLKSKGWKVISNPSELQAGDIIYYSRGHVEIYAGDGKKYNAGSGEKIRASSPYSSNFSSMTHALRAPN